MRPQSECKYRKNRNSSSFKVQKSKPIIDKIDKALAPHYGLTNDELDFIVNYDIKFRDGIVIQYGRDSGRTAADI